MGGKSPISEEDFLSELKIEPNSPMLEQVMASIFLFLLKLPWRNAITQNRRATSAGIDELSR